MMDFYWLEYSYYDHPDKYSLILYCSWCNLKCYGCHNRHLAWWEYNDQEDTQNEKISVESEKYYKKLSETELKLAVQNDVLDMIILCGGEMLIYPIKWIKDNQSNKVNQIQSNQSKTINQIRSNTIKSVKDNQSKTINQR